MEYFANNSGDAADSSIVRETRPARLIDQALSRGGIAEACAVSKRIGSHVNPGDGDLLPSDTHRLHLEKAAMEKGHYPMVCTCGSCLLPNDESFYGFASGDPLRFKRVVGHKDLFYIDDKDVEFKDVVEAPLPKAPLDTAVIAHWLAIEGVQPAIPENAPVEALVVPSDNKKSEFKQEGLPVDIKLPVKQVLSRELQVETSFSLTTKNDCKPPEFKGKTTFYVIICWITVFLANLLLGYDIGVLGAVTYTEDFLWEFFRQDLYEKRYTKVNNYCEYRKLHLQLITSTLYIVALLSAILLCTLGSRWGQRRILRIASILTLLGVSLSTVAGFGFEARATNIFVLITARMFLGIGIGLCYKVVPSFISEIPHTKVQEDLNGWSQIGSNFGTFAANLISLIASNWHHWGWRVSFGTALIPVTILVCCSFLICETPASLVKHGKLNQGKLVLKKTRGFEDVNEEFDWIIMHNDMIQKIRSPIKELLKPSNRPALVITFVMQVVLQLTGAVATMSYAPIFFQSISFKTNAALLSSISSPFITIIGTLLSIYLIKKIGIRRRKLLLAACFVMFVSQCANGIIIRRLKSTGTLRPVEAVIVLVLNCFYVMGYSWLSGPLGWLSGTFPSGAVDVGLLFTIGCNMMMSFVMAHASMGMICKMHAGLFFCSAILIVFAAIFIFFMVPMTEDAPVDALAEEVWMKHWYWKKFVYNASSKLPRPSHQRAHLLS